MFDQLFGGKPWFKSMVGWAALLFIVAETAVPAASELGLMNAETATMLGGWMAKAAALLGGLGIRRRLPK